MRDNEINVIFGEIVMQSVMNQNNFNYTSLLHEFNSNIY